MAYTTLADAKAAYLANAGYEAASSRAQALAFVEACRALAVLLPSRSRAGRSGVEVEMDPTLVSEEGRQARRWLGQGGGTSAPGVRYADLSNFRD